MAGLPQIVILAFEHTRDGIPVANEPIKARLPLSAAFSDTEGRPRGPLDCVSKPFNECRNVILFGREGIAPSQTVRRKHEARLHVATVLAIDVKQERPDAAELLLPLPCFIHTSLFSFFGSFFLFRKFFGIFFGRLFRKFFCFKPPDHSKPLIGWL